MDEPSPETPRETKPPKVTKAPPQGKKFPCVQCGARLDFDPSSRSLACPYCGHKEVIAPESGELEEHPLDGYLKRKQVGAKVLEGRSSQVTCSSCGAVVLLEDKVVTDRCPYCHSHLENKPEAAEQMLEPEGVLPFKLVQKEAYEAFNKWLHSLWFAPSTLRIFANLGELKGFYIPFWTFDSMTYTHYSGQRGDNYTVQESYTDAQGNRQTRTVVHTRWTWVSGEVDHFFDDVLICASQGLPENYATRITPRELNDLEAFKPEFLSGFKTERYVMDPSEGFDRAKQIMDGRIREMCRRDIGGDAQQLTSVRTQHIGVTFKYVLLPVWMANYRYHDKAFRVVVNGRTGEVMGDRPWSYAKIIGLIVLILALIVGVAFLVQCFKGGGRESKVPDSRRTQLTSPHVTTIMDHANRTYQGDQSWQSRRSMKTWLGEPKSCMTSVCACNWRQLTEVGSSP